MGFGKKSTNKNSRTTKNNYTKKNSNRNENKDISNNKRKYNDTQDNYTSEFDDDDYSDIIKQSMQQEGLFDTNTNYSEYSQTKERYPVNENKNSANNIKRKSVNREILVVTYIFIGLFILLLGNFTHFLLSGSKTVINNTYNKRQDLLAERIVRGQILGNDHEVLAQTVTDDKGNEKRVYPYKNMFSHVVGRFDQGKTGIELSENFNLLTSNANPIEKVLNELSEKKNIGDNIVTTLDVGLQKVAYNALGNRKGAVVVLEPSTGKILAMVSRPDYDPNKVSAMWESLVEDSGNNSALINRTTQGLYPPGSTFKIVTTLEYIREHANNKKFEYQCTGKYSIADMTIKCYNNKVHGKLNLKAAFAKSCNTTYASIAEKLNRSAWRDTAQSILFNKELPLSIPYKQSSFTLDASSDKKLAAQTAIGQGNTLISPMHNALIVSAIANGGTLMKPYVVDRIENYVGDVVKKYMPSTYGNLMSEEEAKILTDMMKEVVNNGTAYRLKSSKYQAAGKTGSAEFNAGKSSHAWFVGFAPADNPDLVVSIIVEGAGTGSDYAVPIARKIFDAYYNR